MIVMRRNAFVQAAGPVTVGDVMTKAHVFFARPSTTINEGDDH